MIYYDLFMIYLIIYLFTYTNVLIYVLEMVRKVSFSK